jgi:diacylglycerol kinase family enzyme
VEGAARALASPNTALLDLGRIEFLGARGAREVRHFANVAGFGISGLVSRTVNQGLRLPSGKLSFMLASARALLSWSDQPVRWRTDGGAWQEERITAVSVCNGRYFGGGMMVAPNARMDDGLFDVVVWRGLGIGVFVMNKGRLYDGTHVELENTSVLRARVVEAEPLEGAEVQLDVDGESPGTLPARFTILPGALRIRVGS